MKKRFLETMLVQVPYCHADLVSRWGRPVVDQQVRMVAGELERTADQLYAGCIRRAALDFMLGLKSHDDRLIVSIALMATLKKRFEALN